LAGQRLAQGEGWLIVFNRIAWAGPLALIACASAQAQRVSYDDVAPILAARCVVCHNGAAAPLELRLDSLDGVLKGSKNGPVVKAADAAGSELIRRIKGLSQPRMPMTGPPYLAEPEIALIERWVAAGLERGSTASVSAPAPASSRRPAPGEAVTYAHVAPIFATRCVKCHSPNGLMGPAPEGYVLTSYEATLASADRARVVPGAADASELVRRVRGQARPRMPFDGPPYLSDDEVALITDWINQGARTADGQRAAVPGGAQVRLHGTLRGAWRLDELPLTVTPSTRVQANPDGADYVEVRGLLRNDGAVTAQRIRRR
jgi:mono/diheme cytochrome c family protein